MLLDLIVHITLQTIQTNASEIHVHMTLEFEVYVKSQIEEQMCLHMF